MESRVNEQYIHASFRQVGLLPGGLNLVVLAYLAYKGIHIGQDRGGGDYLCLLVLFNRNTP